MIYGRNFNGTQIPNRMTQWFPERVRYPGAKRGQWAYLKGVGQSEQERNAMLIVLGQRGRVVVERSSLTGTLYGIYVY